MNQAVVEFLKKASEDEGLQARLQAAADVDEAYAIASGVQDGFTKEEFVEDVAKIRDAISDNEELSDDDLKKIAGGEEKSSVEVAVICTFAYSASGFIIGASAAAV